MINIVRRSILFSALESAIRSLRSFSASRFVAADNYRVSSTLHLSDEELNLARLSFVNRLNVFD